MKKKPISFLFPWCLLLCAGSLFAAAADPLEEGFRNPPDSARPGVYWYFMDGNLSREGMTRDLEAMKAAGLGRLVFLEVNVDIPRGPVGFMSDEWQELFAHAVHEAERLGIEITLGLGPGWTGSGGPWVKPEQSMQHLVADEVEVEGPLKVHQVLPVAPPHPPFFEPVPDHMRAQWEGFYRDVAVLAFPTPSAAFKIPDISEKSLVQRAPYTSTPGVKAYLDALAEFPAAPEGSMIPLENVVDLTGRMKADGTLDWDVPPGKWTILRFVSRNNGAATRPSPLPGLGFECDKFDTVAFDAHFDAYVGKLLQKVGPRKKGAGWTMLHIDSWEMGAQNWTPKLREEFLKRRGYDPQPFYPAYLGYVVGSREMTERFLWDLRRTGSELVVENHAGYSKTLGRQHGFTLSIEPYDMNPSCDFDLGAVADIPMAEFWSNTFNGAFSCIEAVSIAHVMGLPVVAAEAFTAHREDWRYYPGSLKDEGDWAFATGINRFFYHTFQHHPNEDRPGMTMGPYGVHWDRGQTWWSMVAAYHRYIARCQYLLSQGRTMADVLYLMPEGAPNVFLPPASAMEGSSFLPDRRGYNFDGCSPEALIKLADVRDGRVVFPGGASYRLLVLPNFSTMTPELLDKITALVRAGATVVGAPPQKSPSLVNYPECDRAVTAKAEELWGTLQPPATLTERSYGKGRIVWGGALYAGAPIMSASWIWYPEGNPAVEAPLESVTFRREFSVTDDRKPASAVLEMTVDNEITVEVNGVRIGKGDNFTKVYRFDVLGALKAGGNVITVRATNNGDTPGPAGLIASLQLSCADGSDQQIVTDEQWRVSRSDGDEKPAKVLGPAGMLPWRLSAQPELYPRYGLTAEILRKMGVGENFRSPGPLRYTHRSTEDREIYFVSNRTDAPLETSASFRVTGRQPELWDSVTGEIRPLPEFTVTGGMTTIPLQFAPSESFFIVFPKEEASPASGKNFVAWKPVSELAGPWEVSFDLQWGGPEKITFEKLEDWSKRPEEGIRYYSGKATYRTSFDGNHGQFLALGKVAVMAAVKLNGQDLGVAWCAPWRVAIPPGLLRERNNQLEITVANLWPNRLIGDAALPEAQRKTRTTFRPYTKDSPLLESGLLGPVQILVAEGVTPKK